MLTNLSKSRQKAKKLEQTKRHTLRDTEDHSDQLWASAMKRFWKKHPFKFERVIEPYKPTGDEYVPDTAKDFTGVYLLNGYDEEMVINMLSNQRCVKTLVDYGCVDNATQAIENFNSYLKLMSGFGHEIKGNYVIFMRPMRRDRVYTFEEAMGTFRWHKNGGYSGKANVCSEYFLNEPDEKLKLVYTYTVCKIV